MSAFTGASDLSGARCWWGVLAFLPSLALAAGQEGAGFEGRTIAEVTVLWADGREAPIPEAALRLLAVEAGDRYSKLRIRRSVKHLFALDAFDDVRVHASRLEAGEVRLVFELAPALRIASFGVRDAPLGQAAALNRVFAVRTGDRPRNLEAARQEAEEHLRAEGWFDARVDVRTEPVADGMAVDAIVRAGPREVVGAFRAEGVAPAQGARLQRMLGASPGRPVSESTFEAGLAEVEGALRAEGFLSARADYELEPGGAAAGPGVVLRVEPGPRVTLQFEGFPEEGGGFDAMRTRLGETGLDEDALEAARQELLARLRDGGYRDARVDVLQTPSADGAALRVRFVAEPGRRFVAREARVDGAPPELAARLRELAEPLADGEPFRETAWEAALDAMRAALRREGRYQAEVTGSASPVASGSRELRLLAEVRAGPRARIATVDFEGNARHPAAELAAVVPIVPGDPFVTENVVAAREALQAWYRRRGFLEASVSAEAPVLPETHEAAVVFRVLEGEFLTVGRIVVAGAEVTREGFIRSRIPFAEGDPLSSEGILETRRRALATGVFSEVEVELLEPEEPVGERNLLVRVAEAPRNRIGYGAGYSQREQVRAEGEWTRGNLFGRNHTLSLFGRLSLRGTRFITTYRGAEGLEREAPVFASAYRESQDRESFDFLRYGAGVQLSRRVLGRNLILRYDFTRSELFDLRISPSEIYRDFADNLWLSTVSASVVADTRDDPVSPRRGRFGILDLEWSSAQLGSRAPFVKGLAQQFLYLPVSPRVVLAVAGRVGMAAALDDSGEEGVGWIPITERFFAGGATTLRGYPLDRAGPVDASGYPLGGNMLAIGNLEARIRIAGNVSVALFSDHGGVFARIEDFRLEDVGHHVGAGLRWDTPLGPVRFDYGFRLEAPGDESRGQWHFTIGHAF